jgi:hypothetical protein
MSGPFHPTDEHFCAIGKVADAWATLELWINRTIWELMDVEQRVGACVTAHIGSFGARMRALIALVILRGGDDNALKVLNKFSTDTEGLARQRNRVIHDAWFGQHGTRNPYQFVATADRRLDFGFKPVPTKDLDELLAKIQQAIRFFEFTISNIFETLPSFSRTRFSQSEGINPPRGKD